MEVLLVGVGPELGWGEAGHPGQGLSQGVGEGEELVPHTHLPGVRGLCDARPLESHASPRTQRQQPPSPLSGRKLIPLESDHESFSQDFRPVAPWFSLLPLPVNRR